MGVTSQNIPDLRSDISTSGIETLENTETVGRQDSSLCIHERMSVVSVMKAGIMTHDFEPNPGWVRTVLKSKICSVLIFLRNETEPIRLRRIIDLEPFRCSGCG